MNIFSRHARYYDLLYRDKPYREEALYARRLARLHIPSVTTIVDLGCGTGAHAEHLARAGVETHGVDISDSMLELAEARASILPNEIAHRMHFSLGDVRQVRLDVRADAVISLFHVMSYQPNDEDVKALVLTLRLVKQCFKSAEHSSTCIEDHHPSCLKLVEARLKEYDVHSLQGQRSRAKGS